MTTTYSDFRARLAELWDVATDDREVITVTRRGKEDLAVLPASELRSMQETLHLLSSRQNARRLFDAMDWAESAEAYEQTTDIDELRKQLTTGSVTAEA